MLLLLEAWVLTHHEALESPALFELTLLYDAVILQDHGPVFLFQAMIRTGEAFFITDVPVTFSRLLLGPSWYGEKPPPLYQPQLLNEVQVVSCHMSVSTQGSAWRLVTMKKSLLIK